MYQHTNDTGRAVKLPLRQEAWMMFRFDNHEVIRLNLAPGEILANHANSWRIIFWVLSGEGTLEVSGDPFHLAAGQSIAVNAGLERSWHNSGNRALELLVIKTEENS